MKTEVIRRELQPSHEMVLARSAVLDEDRGALGNMVFAISLRPDGMSPLARRPLAPRSQALAAPEPDGADTIRQVRIVLHDGAITVNGRTTTIPPGLAGPMTGKEFKRFAGVYARHALFVQRDGGMQRVRDNQTVEVVPDSRFTHRMEPPVVSSAPRFGRD